MKELINLHFWEQDRREDSQHFNPLLFAECRRRFPQFFQNPNIMDAWAEKDDPILQKIIGFLREHNREPYLKRFPSWAEIYYGHPIIYPTEGKRLYEPEDYANAEYFVLIPETLITNHGSKDDEGHLKIKRSQLKRQPFGRTCSWSKPVCRDSFGRAMAVESFAGLVFQPVEIIGQKAGDEAIWALSSDREMPTLLNQFVCEDGTDYDRSKALGCYVDDFHYPPILRFPAKQVRLMEPFDVAITKERPHHKQGPGFTGDVMKRFDPYFIVSRHFREWCLKQKLKIEWWPVVLE